MSGITKLDGGPSSNKISKFLDIYIFPCSFVGRLVSNSELSTRQPLASFAILGLITRYLLRRKVLAARSFKRATLFSLLQADPWITDSRIRRSVYEACFSYSFSFFLEQRRKIIAQILLGEFN